MRRLFVADDDEQVDDGDGDGLVQSRPDLEVEGNLMAVIDQRFRNTLGTAFGTAFLLCCGLFWTQVLDFRLCY